MREENVSKNNTKDSGFTLIELLAVIVILGLLLAIAIPSITKYIVESRKKTVVSSINSYISSTITSVNEQDYNFTIPNTIYALPIECIAVEKGGTNPFGEWSQANDEYWAYVLLQYDNTDFSYNYGFTFKDSAGYGMYPTVESEINFKSKEQIKNGLKLTKPKSTKATSIASIDNWNGFKVDSETNLVVLEAESKAIPGDGENTCTLYQEGSNYQFVENEKNKQLIRKIRNDNPLITAKPTLTTTNVEAGDASGLYMSRDTNNGEPTYYFRGSVDNYVEFAEQIWRIVRINEDGTIRLILQNGIKSKFNTINNVYPYMYYSNSDTAMSTLTSWYNSNLLKYDSYIVESKFCEQSKVKKASSYTSGNTVMDIYTAYKPDFKCTTDGNEKGIIDSKIGMITIDEVIYAGGYFGFSSKNSGYYLNIGKDWWTMSPGGLYAVNEVWALDWYVAYNGGVDCHHVANEHIVRPVISLYGDVKVTGTGTSDDPYVVQTN